MLEEDRERPQMRGAVVMCKPVFYNIYLEPRCSWSFGLLVSLFFNSIFSEGPSILRGKGEAS